MGMDYRVIAKCLEELGYNVEIIDFSKIAENYNLLPKDSLLFYSFSYNDTYHQYMKDVIYDLKQCRPDVILLPDLDMLYSFENKGYQELLKKRLNLGNLNGRYIGDISDLKDEKLNFPVVYKLLNGAVSSGVFLVKNQVELEKLVQNRTKRSLWELINYWRRLRKKNNPTSMTPSHELVERNFKDFFSKRHLFVIQDFIPDLDCDYRVLVFGDKFYTTKRMVRENDFRASGSGKQEWVEPSKKMLEFAKDIREKLNVPIIALDIAKDNKEFFLIEFLSLGFGAVTLIKSEFYYKFESNNWTKVSEKSNLEETYAYAINYFLSSNNLVLAQNKKD